MSDQCDLCGAADDLAKFDVFNQSGAVLVRVCDDCDRRLGGEGCAVCGDAVAAAADESIARHGDPNDHRPICPECRREIIFSEGVW